MKGGQIDPPKKKLSSKSPALLELMLVNWLESIMIYHGGGENILIDLKHELELKALTYLLQQQLLLPWVKN